MKGELIILNYILLGIIVSTIANLLAIILAMLKFRRCADAQMSRLEWVKRSFQAIWELFETHATPKSIIVGLLFSAIYFILLWPVALIIIVGAVVWFFKTLKNAENSLMR